MVSLSICICRTIEYFLRFADDDDDDDEGGGVMTPVYQGA